MCAVNNTIISIVPDLKGGMGHMYGYHKAVGDAARINGWQHFVATAPDQILWSLPDGWVACLETGGLELNFKRLIRQQNIFLIIKEVSIFAFSIAKFVRGNLVRNEGQTILFIERFNPMQLLSLLISVIGVNRKHLNCWVLFRYEPLFFGMNGGIYKILTSCFRLLLGDDRFKLIADSEPLSTALAAYFKRPVYVVPIPHTHGEDKVAISHKMGDEVVLWWPGSPRIDKGWDIIKKIVNVSSKTIPLTRRVRLIVSDAAGIPESRQNPIVQLVKNVLPEDEYKRYLFCSDIILLPYKADIYRASTSGIFTEAIAAGVIPLVSDGTWMAYELKKASLDELVIDWNQRNLINNILSFATNSEVRRKINILRDKYLRFHSVKSFARTIDGLLDAPSSSNFLDPK